MLTTTARQIQADIDLVALYETAREQWYAADRLLSLLASLPETPENARLHHKALGLEQNLRARMTTAWKKC